jgi:hypothetical protein
MRLDVLVCDDARAGRLSPTAVSAANAVAIGYFICLPLLARLLIFNIAPQSRRLRRILIGILR